MRRLAGAGLVLGVAVLSLSAVADERADDRRLQQEMGQAFKMADPVVAPSIPAPKADGALEVDETDLLNHPHLLSRAMLSALVYDSSEHLKILLPIYQKLPKAHIKPEILMWADAVLANAQGKHQDAIKGYEALLSQYPNHALFGVRLGQALFNQRRYGDAKRVFLAQDPQIQALTHAYIQAIQRLEKPQISLSANIINDKNINNAPKNRDLGGGWVANDPQSAKGVYGSVSIEKSHLLPDGVIFRPQLSMHTKRYQDAKQYDEMSAQLSGAISIHRPRHSITITPSYERTHYAGGQKNQTKMRHFSDTVGLGMDYDWRATSTLGVSLGAHLYKNSYQTRTHLNGHTLSLTPALTLTPKGNLSMAKLALNYQRTHTQSKDDSFVRYGVQGTVLGHFGDVGVQGSVGIARREYGAPMPIFNQTQVNDEFYGHVSLWHDKIRYRQFVPRLSYHYQKTDSNIALYSYDKGRLFVEVVGRF